MYVLFPLCISLVSFPKRIFIFHWLGCLTGLVYSGVDALMKSENFQQPMLLGYETLVTVAATTNLPWHIHPDMVSLVSMTKYVNMFSLIRGQIQSDMHR